MQNSLLIIALSYLKDEETEHGFVVWDYRLILRQKCTGNLVFVSSFLLLEGDDDRDVLTMQSLVKSAFL